MSNYEPYYIPNLIFVTCMTVNRDPVLSSDATIHLLQTILDQLKRSHPFQTVAYAFLPDHFHLMIKVNQSVSLNDLIHHLWRRYGRDYQTLLGIPGKMLVWEERFKNHPIANRTEFAKHLDYLHYNPVQHGLAKRPEEWPASSYETWVERRVYKLGWGWTKPDSIVNVQARLLE
ncbi:transposase [Chloroflexi bacterium TSY]|nr:transposase [Chloroflexi bacterium TSY]